MTTSTEKEVTATAIGASLATIGVISVEWFVGAPAPSGLEGALAVLGGAGIGMIRKWIRNRRKTDATNQEL